MMTETTKPERTTQTYAALAVGLVCIVVGLPLWWKTTLIYRVPLPYNEISSLHTAQVYCQVNFTVLIASSAIDSYKDELEKLLNNIQSDDDLHIVYNGKVRSANEMQQKLLLSSKSTSELENALGLRDSDEYTLLILPDNTPLILNDFNGKVGTEKVSYLKYKGDGLETLLQQITFIIHNVYVNKESLARILQHARHTKQLPINKETMRSFRSHVGYDITFTLLNPQPDMVQAKWEIEQAIDKYLKGFLREMNPYSKLEVKSQYLYYIGLGIVPRKHSTGQYYVLPESELPHIINPIEAHLASHVSNQAQINFVVYVPTRNQSPLYIVGNEGDVPSSNALLSPRWGGILVYNVESTVNDTLPLHVTLYMKRVLEVFTSQLRQLLGFDTVEQKYGILIEVPNEGIVSKWELEKWLRSNCIENVASGTATLQSLAQLLEQISNIVINDHIGKEVEIAVDAIQRANKYLSDGRLRDAYLASTQAFLSSEKAFFDPSLLELLYFPEDQKFAIYIPLFLPMSIPVVLSLYQALRFIKEKRQKAKSD